MSIVASTDPRIREVKVTTDTIVAYQWTVVSSVYRWSGPGGCRKRHLRSGHTLSLSVTGKGCTGRTSMKTSAWKVCSGVPAHRPQSLVHFRGVQNQGHREPPNKRMERTRKTRRSS
jgi:hypothetical protein